MRVQSGWKAASVLCAAIAGLGTNNAISRGGKRDCGRTAVTMVIAMARGDMAAAAADFDLAMRKALPEEAIAVVWGATVVKYGAYIGVGTPQVDKGPVETPHLVTVPIRFASATVDGIVACDTNGAVAGFHLLVHPAEPKVSAKEPAFEAEDERIQSAGVELGATFYRPRSAKALFPLVVLVGGSGPMDRDSTIGANKPMRDMAVGLAREGIGVLAFDKRTFAFPLKPIATIDDEVVDDAVAAIRHGALRQDVDKSRIFVLGHSLGGTVAPRIAQRSSDVAGIILLAPLIEPLDEAYLRQLRYLAARDGRIDESEQATVAEAEIAEKRLSDARKGIVPDGPLPMGIPASYWKDLWSYDPVAIAREVRCPVLVLFAGRDYQVLAEESKKKWQAGFVDEPSLQIRVYPTLGHTFMPMTDPPDPAVLLSAAHVDPAVIGDVAAWVLKH